MTRRTRVGLSGLALVALAGGAWSQRSALFGEAAPRSAYGFEPGERVAELRFRDYDGQRARLSDLFEDGARLVVVAMTDPGCPVAARYAPRLARLEREYAGRGVRFAYVNANPSADESAARAQIEQHGLLGPYAHDPDGSLVGALQARATAEVFVIDAAGTLIYRGAVDDQYGIGWTKPAATRSWLRQSLDAALAGERPAVRRTDAEGCLLPTDLAGAPRARPVTWHARVSRILQDNCQTCHRAGGVAPFGLETYEQAAGYRAMIRYVVENRIMPPWFAHEEIGEWANERRLSDRARADLFAWIDAGAPRGDPDEAPLPRSWVEGWHIGEPDAVVEIPEPIAVAAEGVMDYQYVHVKTDFPEDRWIARMELRPSAPDVTHHILAFLEEPGRPSAQQAGPGEPVAQGGLNGYLAAYVPGAVGHTFPPNTAKRLPKGGWIKFQLHYTPNGTARLDRTRLGFVFADGPPEREIETWSAFDTRFVIPPGAKRHAVTGERRFRRAGTLLALFPHMHLRGAAFRYELVHPDQRIEPILDVPRYDFNWQLTYEPAEPIRVEAGTVLRATGWFDNSADNPANPDATTEVTFGEQSFDEMMIGFFDWIPDADAAGSR